MTWRGRSHGFGYLIFDEYLQACYFALYVIVAGVPFLIWYLARKQSGFRATGLGPSGGASSAGAGTSPSGHSSLSSGVPSVPVSPESSEAPAPDLDSPYTPSSLPPTSYAAAQRAKHARLPFYYFDVSMVSE